MPTFSTPVFRTAFAVITVALLTMACDKQSVSPCNRHSHPDKSRPNPVTDTSSVGVLVPGGVEWARQQG